MMVLSNHELRYHGAKWINEYTKDWERNELMSFLNKGVRTKNLSQALFEFGDLFIEFTDTFVDPTDGVFDRFVDIAKVTKFNKLPGWGTVKKRFWAVANELGTPVRSAKVQVLNTKTGKYEIRTVYKEIHHIEGRQIEGANKLDNLIDVWPWEHATIDPNRNLGYEFIQFVK